MSENTHPSGKANFATYQEVLDYLYTQLPMFQRMGASAFKKDLTNTHALCEYLDHPEHRFKSVHIAGTNGKGSSSHYLAAILQSAGYKTGLYTSPHLKNFTERIKINGKEIEENKILDFMNRVKPCIDELKPSFFELTVGMAFDHFAHHQVDIAVIEVGMGGRLDSTNVIIPEVSLITNISADHQQWLGHDPADIAGEKAGIIKQNIPVVVSEKQEGIYPVFERIAFEKESALYFSTDTYQAEFNHQGQLVVSGSSHYTLNVQQAGRYQMYNIPGVIKTIDVLRQRGFEIADEHIKTGIEQVKTITGLKGRWQILKAEPLMICDVGHNEAGVEILLRQIDATPHQKLHMVWGMVNDKDVSGIMNLLPKVATYYFCQAQIPRAMPAEDLCHEAQKHGLHGEIVKNVNEAIEAAQTQASRGDLIFIGGSTFVVAEIDDL